MKSSNRIFYECSPFPWRFNKKDLFPVVIDGAEGDAIASIHSRNPGDVRLIAAAPDLLKACETALEDCRMALNGEWEPSQEGFEVMVENLGTAIRKAKGRDLVRKKPDSPQKGKFI